MRLLKLRLTRRAQDLEEAGDPKTRPDGPKAAIAEGLQGLEEAGDLKTAPKTPKAGFAGLAQDPRGKLST